MEVKDKQEMYRGLRAGRFGNRAISFDTLSEFQASGYTGLMGIRSIDIIGFRTRYNLPADQVAAEVAKIGLPADTLKLQFVPMQPDQHLIWQGEICHLVTGLYAHISFEKAAMKIALARKSEHWQGVRLRALFQTTMTPSDQSDLEELLLDYPDSVIELSVYDILIGTCPHRRTLFWEVRNY